VHDCELPRLELIAHRTLRPARNRATLFDALKERKVGSPTLNGLPLPTSCQQQTMADWKSVGNAKSKRGNHR
jgi:hypothetical protein